LLELGLKMLIAYLLGSLSGSLLVGKLYGGVDIRASGSGNAGGTNALRTQGSVFALWVVLIDIAKGALAVWWVSGLEIPGVGVDPAVSRDWLQVACAGAAVVGHVYPVWFDFRGGKGAATLVGVFLVLIPKLVIVVIVVWVLVLVLTGYVGLSTMSGAVAAPVALYLTSGLSKPPLLSFLVLMALFVLYTHRANIIRMREGTENRMRKVMLFRQ